MIKELSINNFFWAISTENKLKIPCWKPYKVHSITPHEVKACSYLVDFEPNETDKFIIFNKKDVYPIPFSDTWAVFFGAREIGKIKDNSQTTFYYNGLFLNWSEHTGFSTQVGSSLKRFNIKYVHDFQSLMTSLGITPKVLYNRTELHWGLVKLKIDKT